MYIYPQVYNVWLVRIFFTLMPCSSFSYLITQLTVHVTLWNKKESYVYDMSRTCWHLLKKTSFTTCSLISLLNIVIIFTVQDYLFILNLYFVLKVLFILNLLTIYFWYSLVNQNSQTIHVYLFVDPLVALFVYQIHNKIWKGKLVVWFKVFGSIIKNEEKTN